MTCHPLAPPSRGPRPELTRHSTHFYNRPSLMNPSPDAATRTFDALAGRAGRRGPGGRAVGAIVLLALLLSLAQAQAIESFVGALWHTAVISWQDPSTEVAEIIDEVAYASVPHTALREARDDTGLVPRPCGDSLVRSLAVPTAPSLRSGLTRSPPSA